MRAPLSPGSSRMTRRESIAALAYLPVHVLLLPLAMSFVLLPLIPSLSDAAFNLIYYAVGLVYMLAFELRFLRRDFDPLCDRPFNCLVEVLAGYGIMLALNLAVNSLLSLFPADNPNNAAVMDMANMEMGTVSAMAVFMAPIVEEILFRGAVFGLLRRKSRVLAYAASILLFSLYHVWSFALLDAAALLYLVQYIPASFVLCRCYERTESVWAPIFLHMLINGVSLSLLSQLEELLCRML